MLLPVLDGLRDVHQRGFLHRDVKPHNIYLTAQGRPILLDFGSARQAMGARSRSLSVVLTEGFAPFEQYTRRGGQGPWTDIYGAAATLYLLITGQTPLPAPERVQHDALIPPQQLVPELPPPLNAALLHGLAMDPHQRPPTMDQFERALHGILAGTAPPPPAEPARRPAPAEPAPDAPGPDPAAEPQIPAARAGAHKVAAAAAAVLGGLGVILLVTQSDWTAESVRSPAPETATVAAPPPQEVPPAGKPTAADVQQWLERGLAYYLGEGVPQDYAQAFQWFQKAAEQGHDAAAQNILGVMYFNGQGVVKNHAEAARWYRQAAAQDHAGAQNSLGVMYFNGQSVVKNHAEAVRWFRQAAAQGHTGAQYNLGVSYAEGQGVAQDDAEAVRWYRQAAAQGHAEAQLALDRMPPITAPDVNPTAPPQEAPPAVKPSAADVQQWVKRGAAYYLGEDVPQDYTQAFQWFHKAAEQGDADAQYLLGLMYAEGRGVTQNDAEAARWYRQAANQGLAKAQNNLGAMYFNGQGVVKNHAEALRWYRQAAVQGLADAQFNLGLRYANGQGVAQNDAEALRWYRQAAAQGDAGAQLLLGTMYAQGRGVTQNHAEAARWFRQAAAQDHADAQYLLGVMYAEGLGVPQNRTEAARWLRQAAAQGHDEAQNQLRRLNQ